MQVVHQHYLCLASHAQASSRGADLLCCQSATGQMQVRVFEPGLRKSKPLPPFGYIPQDVCLQWVAVHELAQLSCLHRPCPPVNPRQGEEQVAHAPGRACLAAVQVHTPALFQQTEGDGV